VSLLLLLPVLPLALVAGLVLVPGAGRVASAWIVALAAGLVVAVASLAPDQHLPFPELLVKGTSALALDATARAALLLFGGLWLCAALALTRAGAASGPRAPALLIAFSGAVTLALADGGPLIYAGLLATGYGLYAVMAGEAGDAWRRGGRALVVLLVASDLLVFEMLLSSTAEPVVDARAELLAMGLAAVILRGAIPPAHAWLPPALAGVSLPTALLLVAAPCGAAMFGALKILPQGAVEMGPACALLAFAGAGWALAIGVAQPQSRAVLAYAGAATAALLLLALPAGAGGEFRLAWVGLALLVCCAAVPLGEGASGTLRDVALGTAVVAHALAAGEAALHSTAALGPGTGWMAPLVAVAAICLLTIAVRRTPSSAATPTAGIILLPLGLAIAGLLVAWLASPPRFASLWPAPIGITLGLIAVRLLPTRPKPLLPAGDLLGPAERAVAAVLGGARVLCLGALPRWRDVLQGRVLGLWDGAAWSDRMLRLDLRLRAWPTTSLMMLLVALGAAWLLAR
jgi:hypothetical protein